MANNFKAYFARRDERPYSSEFLYLVKFSRALHVGENATKISLIINCIRDDSYIQRLSSYYFFVLPVKRLRALLYRHFNYSLVQNPSRLERSLEMSSMPEIFNLRYFDKRKYERAANHLSANYLTNGMHGTYR